MLRKFHSASSVTHIKSTVNIQIIRGLLQCYSIVKNIFQNFYLTIFLAINTNIMNKTIRTEIEILIMEILIMAHCSLATTCFQGLIQKIRAASSIGQKGYFLWKKGHPNVTSPYSNSFLRSIKFFGSIEILDWCPVGSVWSHWKKVSL